MPAAERIEQDRARRAGRLAELRAAVARGQEAGERDRRLAARLERLAAARRARALRAETLARGGPNLVLVR